MRLMIQCQEIIFEGYPGTPLFLPDISQQLVYLCLPFLMDQKAPDLICQIFHLALFLTAQDPGTALCQCCLLYTALLICVTSIAACTYVNFDGLVELSYSCFFNKADSLWCII